MTTSRQQPYDSSLKALLAENAATVLPLFIKGAVFLDELDVELLSPARRADRVFLIQLQGRQCIVDMEIQSSVDKTIVQSYQNDEARLARQLLWMGILLQRSTSIAVEEKREIQRRFNMFDQLLEEDPRVIELMAEREARGRMEGKAEGKVEGKAELVTTLIATRFPSLTEEIRQKLPRVRRSEDLDTLAKLTITAPDENALRWVLDSLVA